MAIPAISPLAAKAAPPGKPTNPAGNDQGAADFAAVLAQQRPAHSGDGSAPPSAQASRSATANAPPAAIPLAGEIAIATTADAGMLQAELPEIPTVDLENPGKMAAAHVHANEKDSGEKDLRGQTNALEQIARNPGLGLGLTATASTAGLPTEASGKAGKRPEKDLAASSVDAPLTPDVAPLPIPLTFPASSRFDDHAAAADPLLSAGSAVKPQASETLTQTANLAGESLAPGSGSQQTFSAALAAQHAAAGSESAKAAPPNIDTPLQNPNWGKSFGEGVVWMAKNDQQSAQININPPQLGPLQITLHLNGDQASAVFASPHAEVRQAIQDAMPQLRDMLAASGINLGQADVGSQGSTAGREFAAQQGNQNRSGDENAILSPDTQFADKSPGQPILRGRGLVDLFA